RRGNCKLQKYSRRRNYPICFIRTFEANIVCPSFFACPKVLYLLFLVLLFHVLVSFLLPPHSIIILCFVRKGLSSSLALREAHFNSKNILVQSSRFVAALHHKIVHTC